MAASTNSEPTHPNPDPLAPHGFQPSHGQQHQSYFSLLPRWLLIAFALVLIVGTILVAGRGKFEENAAFDAMSTCEARLFERTIKDERYNNYLHLIKDGTHDGFASIHIGAQRDGIARVISLCDVEPARGLRLFRRALDSGNVSAKIVALYCANFLARSQTRPGPDSARGVLEAEDFARMLSKIDPAGEPDEEVRITALRALSDLVVLSTPAKKDAYEKLPAIPAVSATPPRPDAPKESDDTIKSIKTHEDKLDGKAILQIRWSGPALARAWWKEQAGAGAWNAAQQRFVIP